MPPILYAHPFSSYCQKVLIALYENDTRFAFRMLDDANGFAALEARWPHKKFPILVDGDATLIESSIIIEYLMLRYPGFVQLIPTDPHTALRARFMDRFFDNYVMTPMQKVVGDALLPLASRDSQSVGNARACLDVSYQWLNSVMHDRQWAAAAGSR